MQSRTERAEDELKRVVADAQELLQHGGERADEARSIFAARVANARDRVISMEKLAARRARDAADEVDRYAHEHPWRMAAAGVAIAAVVAIALSFLAASRRE